MNGLYLGTAQVLEYENPNLRSASYLKQAPTAEWERHVRMWIEDKFGCVASRPLASSRQTCLRMKPMPH